MASKIRASFVHNNTPCTDVKDKTPVVGSVVNLSQVEETQDTSKPELKPGESVEKKLSEDEAFNLTKAEQLDLIEKLGSSEMPRYEKDRVALILKLQ